MNRKVWVLGAGFSKPLGGPLLPDLFSPGSEDRLKAAYEAGAIYEGLFKGWARDVRRIYKDHGPAGPAPQRHWQDAEQFLEVLDAAAAHGVGSPSANLIRGLMNKETDLLALAAAAKRLVAAECCAFLERADPSSEKWAPYRRWLTGMGPTDTIISFNYDTVVETVAEATNYQQLRTVLPGSAQPQAPGVRLLKLHGSVDWRYDGASFSVHENKEFALTCPDAEMVIASPGPTKLKVAKQLNELWTMAEASLREAAAVIFVGYRFPPSDAASRGRLLMALVQNQRPFVALHAVLGPDRGDPATVRLRSLLGHAARQASREEATDRKADYTQSQPSHYTLDVHPLWGEDFMDLFVGGHVVQAYRFPRA